MTTHQWGDKPPTGGLVDLSLNLEAERYFDIMWWDFRIESDPNPSWHLKILLLPMSCITHRLHGEQTLSGRIVGILHANIIPVGIFIGLLRHCTMIYTYKYLVVIGIPEYLVYIRSNPKQYSMYMIHIDVWMESEWNLGGGRQRMSANSRAKVSTRPPNSNSDLPVHLLMACPHRQNGYESKVFYH